MAEREQSLEADLQQTEQLEAHKEAEVAERSPDRGEEVDVSAGERSHFFAVANALLAAIHPHAPELHLPETLTRRESEGVRMIYEAKSGIRSEVGDGKISAAERFEFLNLGLGRLQRVLAMARHPHFTAARGHIEEIRKRLFQLKDELRQRVVDEERNRRDAKSIDPADPDGDQGGKGTSKKAAGKKAAGG